MQGRASSGGRGRFRVGTAPGRALLGSLLLHAVLLALAVIVARNAIAEPAEERDPVRLTFVEALPEPTPVVVSEGGGGGGGGEAVALPEVVQLPPPQERTHHRHVTRPMPDLRAPEELEPQQEDDSTDELELVVPTGAEEAEEEEEEEAADGATEVEGMGAGEGSGTGAGAGGGSGGGRGTGTGTGTGSGVGPGVSAPVYYHAGMERPRRVSGDHPRYTRQAQQAGVEGVVSVLILIGRDGRVRDVRVIGSTIPLLDDEVLRAVRGWRFSPPMVEGRRVEMYLRQPFRFHRQR